MTAAPTEIQHRHARGLQALAPAQVLGHLLLAQTEAIACLPDALSAIDAAAHAAAHALGDGHRLIYAGAGSSGLMALADALELAGTFGIAPESAPILFAGGAEALLRMTGAVEDDPALARADLARAAPAPGDCVICVSASGATPYTLVIAEGARAAGARVVGLANVAESPLLRAADIPLLLDSGPELVAGSTRMGAGTAQKIALNMLSTLMALRLGHVHDGLMVNLVADNAKLRRRAAHIVATVADVPAQTAMAALDTTRGAVKPAILIAAGARDLAEAKALLAESRGHLGPPLTALRADP